MGKHGGVEFFIVPPQKPPANNDNWQDSHFLAGFWWVTPLGPKDPGHVNMIMSTVSVSMLGATSTVKIPILTNKVALKAYTKLTLATNI